MRRRGFTKVEVLVVLSIVGIVICLVIPAMQASRASARQVDCQDRLRNLDFAVSCFTIRKGTFPMNTTFGLGRELDTSCFAYILQDLYSDPNAANYDYSLPNHHPVNSTAVGQTWFFVCPENPASRDPLPSEKVRRADGSTYPAGSAFARSHYAANWGGGRIPGYGDDFTRSEGSHRGIILSGPYPVPPGPVQVVRPSDVTDGLAVTILLGEKRDGQGWAVGGYAGSEFDVGLSPQAADRPDVRMVVTGSYHPGVVNFAFADGSVRAIRDAIDREVWYALMTRDGGEGIEADAW